MDPFCEECREMTDVAQARRQLEKRAKRYGLTLDQYDAMLLAQNGKCYICREGAPANIDHNHTTGAVRKLLCDACNIAVGVMENTERVARVADYLREHRPDLE